MDSPTVTLRGPAPGAVVDFSEPNADYQRDSEHMRWSTIKAALDSPLRLRHALDAVREDKPAWALGRGIHAAVLEPEVWASDDYAIVLDDGSPHVTASGSLSTRKATREWLATLPPETQVITSEQAAEIDTIAAAVHGHAACAAVLARCPDREVSIRWVERVRVGAKEIEIPCKARLDYARLSDATAADTVEIGDLKSGRHDPHPHLWSREIFARRYYAQLGWYARGVAAIGRRIARMSIIAATTSAPYDCAAFRLSDMTIETAEVDAAEALRRYALAHVTGEWPGICPAETEIGLPGYAYSDADDPSEGLTF